MPELSSGYAGGGLVTASAFNSGDSLGSVTLTANATNHVKGSWVELIASTATDANWIEIDITNTSVSTAGSNGMIDIGIGAATEQVIIPDLYTATRSTAGSYAPYLFPVFIPKGSRLSARWQSQATSATIRISIRLISGTLLGGASGPAVVSGYGGTTLSLGPVIDPGAVADTWSAWTQIVASTDRDHRWLVMAARIGDFGITAQTWRVQIGIGAATEEVLIPDMAFSADTTSDMTANPVRSFPIFIPKGSRLTARVRSSTATAGDRTAAIRLYGAG